MAYTYILILEATGVCASRSLEHIIKRSHVSIWKWMQKHADVVDPTP